MADVTVGATAAYLAVPHGSEGPWPGVVVIHEAFGPVPGSEELAHIHRFTLEPLPADQLYVRRMALANTRHSALRPMRRVAKGSSSSLAGCERAPTTR